MPGLQQRQNDGSELRLTFDTRSIQVVTERARHDEDRFIFTLEGRGGSDAELRAMHDRLTADLHLQGGFAPSKRVAPTAPSAPAPADHPAPGATGVDFTAGVQGWTGTYAELTALADGGPKGGGVLQAFDPGEGEVGYAIAPAGMLGDWSGRHGIRLAIRSGTGRYFDAFEDGAYGDVYLASGGMTAAIAFPRRVGPDWSDMDLRFDAPGWVLGGGARNLRDVLANVTDFRIRAEFLYGDATAWLSGVAVYGSGGGHGAELHRHPVNGLCGGVHPGGTVGRAAQ